jgi:ATP-binding cassette, subfamily B, multidrug efflux pump
MSAALRARTTWAVLWPVLRPWRATLAVIAACVLVARVLDLAPAFLVERVVDDHLAAGRSDGLLLLGVLYLATVVAAQTANFGAVYLTAVAAQDGLRALRTRLLAHFHRLPITYFDMNATGDSISRATADIETVDTLFSSGVINLVGNLARIATALGAMLLLDPALTAIALLAVPPLMAITRWFQVRVRDAERLNRQAVGQLTAVLQETLVGADAVRAYDRAPAFVARVRRALQATLDAYNGAAGYSACYTPLIALLAAGTTALLLCAGASGLLGQWRPEISIGELTAFVLLFGRFLDPIAALGDDWQTVQGALSGIERIAAVLALPAEERPAEQPRPGLAASQEGLAVERLTFGYAPARPVVRDVSFCVRPGECVALVGRTGAGKSSIVHLIGGLYAPWAGRVRVAGREPQTLDDAERRRVVGVVPQQLLFFSGTVWENLALGDAAVTRTQVERAIARAGASELIAALPQGYDTPLRAGSGGGMQLSAGQRQLLALARALVWDPPVLLLDEATASIDGASEARLWAALRAGSAGRRAVLVVAHRLATARAAERVIVLDGGRVVEEGPPEALIRRGGRFAVLVELEAVGWDWQEA